MPTIRIDDDVYTWLQKQARPFEDSPNSVLRRIANLENPVIQRTAEPGKKVSQHHRVYQGRRTPQYAFRDPIIRILKKHNGKADRVTVIKELEIIMRDILNDYDRLDISSGAIRWQKTAEWEVRAMRERGILKQVHEEARGVWALTEKGHALI